MTYKIKLWQYAIFATILLFNCLFVSSSFAQNNCASPVVIASLPYSLSGQTTCGRGNTYGSGSCLDPQHYSGEDFVLRYTPAVSGCMRVVVNYSSTATITYPAANFPTVIQLPISSIDPPPAPYKVKSGSPTTPTANPLECYGDVANSRWVCNGGSVTNAGRVGVAVLQACPDVAGSCVKSDTATGINPSISLDGISVTAGQTYYILVSSGDLTPTCGNFTINVTSVTCPPPALPTDPQGVDCGNNLDFEAGSLTGWTGTYKTGSGAPCCPVNPTTPGIVSGGLGTCDANPAGTGGRHTITSGAGTDPNSSGQITVVAPGGKNNSVRIGNQEAGYGAECLENTFTVSAAAPLFTYMYAVVLQDPAGHTNDQKPRFEITIKNNGSQISCGGSYSIVSSGAAADGFAQSTTGCGVSTGTPPWYKKWTAVGTDLTPYIGQTVTVKFCTADCGLGGHFGYAYLDTYCKPKDISGAVICTVGGSATLVGPPGFQGYTWYKAADTVGASVGSGQTITVTGANDGDLYTVKFQSITGSGCWSKVTDTIRVVNATVKADTTICNGASGTYTLNASSNDPTATYAWTSSPAGFTSSQQNPTTTLPAVTTTYSVVVTSPLGCVLTKSTTITVQSCAPNVTATGAQACSGSCATLSSSGSGGTPPYTYQWSGGLGTNQNPVVCSTTGATYTVTVRDNAAQTATATAVLTINPLPTATISKTNNACYGVNTGTATVTAGAGTPAYSYTWAGGVGSAATISGLSPGSYTVTVADSKGCTVTSSTTITEPPQLTVSLSATNVLCNGGSTGSATASAGGGTPGYTYTWNPASGTTATASNKTAGTYTVTVTDANSCTVSAEITITEPPALTSTITGTNISCFNGTDGSATVTAGGGTPGYTYTWNPASGSNASAVNLSANTYSVTVRDANNCSIVSSITLTQPPQLTLTTSNTPVSCFNGTNGTATVTAAGGTPGYTYAWSGGGTTAAITGKTAGTYTVTVTDSKNCQTSTNVTITQPTQLTATASGTNVTCYGGTNGTATATGSGGTTAYTYAWTPAGGTSQSAVGLTASTSGTAYTVTITDANSCTITASVSITQPPQLTLSATGTNVTCYGGSNGSATATGSGGTGTLTYTWSPGGNTGATISNLTASTAGTDYTVTITDANNCTVTASVSLTQPPQLLVTSSRTNVMCYGGSDGTATASATGGTTSYTYLWSPGGNTSATLGSLTASTGGGTTYTVTVTDANGCQTTTTTTLTEPTPLTASTTSANATCGTANGSATVSASGGITAYAYIWSSGSSTTTATALGAGTYTVTVTDQNNCTVTALATVNNPGLPLLGMDSINVTCYGGTNGSATVNILTGSAPPYSYTWNTSPAQTTATATALNAGSFAVTVTDGTGCIKAVSVTITQPTQIITPVNTTPVSCYGGADGTATVTPTGGTPGYTYSWSGGGTNDAITGKTAGTYTVTVTDTNSCTTTATVSITQPTQVTATTTTTPVSCYGGADGTATVTPGGGTPGYTYSWSGGGTTAAITGKTAGTYTVTVTDANSCTTTTTATITQPTQLIPTTTTTDAICGQSNGSATVSATGGTPGYSYSWSNPAGTDATSSGLGAGTYTVTVTDANNCTVSALASVNNPGVPILSMDSSNVTCYGGSNGSATVSIVTGSTPPYTYSWNTTPAQSSATAASLTAGSYAVSVTDGTGCTKALNVTITQPTQITTTTGFTSANCGGANGAATVTASGGTPGYTYSWSTTPAQSAQTATAIPQGTYTVTVTDNNSCQTTTTVIVDDIGAATVTIVSVTDIPCYGGNSGAIDASASGGVPPYTYTWNPGAVTGSEDLNNLTAGSYTITVTSQNGCTATTSATVTEPPQLVPTTTTTDATCGLTNGSATVSATGGTPGYTYSWSNPAGTDATSSGLGAGTYTVTVTDANSCTASALASVNNPGLPLLSMDSSNVTCYGGNNGSATVNIVTGSAPPYTYNWNTSPIQNTSTAINLTSGTYGVTVTDGTGCIKALNVTITQPTQVTATATGTPVSCYGGSNGTATVTAGGGTPGYTYSWTAGSTATTASNLTASAGGTSYTVTVSDNNSCQTTTVVTITQPTQVILTTSVTDVKCAGGSDGTATVTATGGTPGYTYSWSTTPAQNTQAATGLPQGTYTVTVTDANNCTTTTTATLTEPLPITLTTSTTPSNCGKSDGTATVTSTGGTGSYTYSWSTTPTQATDVALAIPQGTYTVTVTDQNNCSATATALVTDIGGPTAMASNTPALCAGSSDGSATATVSGGQSPFQYLWSTTGQTTQTAQNLPAGTYTVTVTAGNGCITTTTTTVTEPTPVVPSTSGQPSTCGMANGSVTANATGGTPTYNYLWSPGGSTSSTVTGLTASAGGTTYTVTVTDGNNCSKTATQTITEIQGPNAALGTADVCVNLPTTFTNGSTPGGNTTLTYLWTLGDGTTSAQSAPQHTYTTAGTYTVTLSVSDGNGCTSTASKTVTIFPDPVVDFSGGTSCVPGLIAFTNNSTPLANTTFVWNFGDGNTLTSPTPTHNYTTPGSYNITLTATTLNGCTQSLTKPSEVVIYPLPVAEFTAAPEVTSILAPDVTFLDLSTDAITWAWEFGDGDTSNVQNPPLHTYLVAGTYEVILTVTNSYGCIDTVIHPVKINPDWTFYVPNAFTPNGDGINDGFIGKGTGITDYEMHIYDRWGNHIYKCKDINAPWDGHANGGREMAQEDVYEYLIFIKNIFGERKRYVGSVTLIR